MVGTFMTMGVSMSGRVTRQSVAMPPVWIFSPTRNPSIVEPTSSVCRAMAYLPMKRRAASICGRPAA